MNLSKKILLGISMISMIFATNVDAAQRTIEADGEYIVGEGMGEDFSTAKERARVFALRNASEQAGVFVESISEVKKLRLTRDEIRTISANVLQVVGDPKFEIVPIDDKAISFKCYVVVVVDDENINEQLMKDRGELIDATRRYKEVVDERDRIQNELDELKLKYASAINEIERQKIRDQVKKNDEEFLATRYFEIGYQKDIEKKYSEAIENYSKAIELNPEFAEAYNNRGNTYYAQGNLNQAISDYNKVIELNPISSMAYNARGNAYSSRGDISQAIADYKKALELDPNNEDARESLNRLQNKK